MSEKCNQKVYPKERYGSFHGHTCGRPVKENGKCGIHCASAVAKRNEKSKKEYEQRVADENLRQRNQAINLLKREGYQIVHPNGESL